MGLAELSSHANPLIHLMLLLTQAGADPGVLIFSFGARHLHLGLPLYRGLARTSLCTSYDRLAELAGMSRTTLLILLALPFVHLGTDPGKRTLPIGAHPLHLTSPLHHSLAVGRDVTPRTDLRTRYDHLAELMGAGLAKLSDRTTLLIRMTMHLVHLDTGHGNLVLSFGARLLHLGLRFHHGLARAFLRASYGRLAELVGMSLTELSGPTILLILG